MYKCRSCGIECASQNARFCSECGASKDAALSNLDLPEQLERYSLFIKEIFFDHSMIEVESLSKVTRDRLKISTVAHQKIVQELVEVKEKIEHLANFKIEFNQNVKDAYVGHDTYLRFRFTNLSNSEFFKVNLAWGESDLQNKIGFNIHGDSIVKPNGVIELGGTCIFPRMGFKEISGMQVTVIDQIGDQAEFKVSSFSFRILNPDQRIIKSVHNHNQISIEGRGVVDASGMGSIKNNSEFNFDIEAPSWKELSISYILKDLPNTIIESELKSIDKEQSILTVAEVQAMNTLNPGYDEDNDISVIRAAQHGNPIAQLQLDLTTATGRGDWDLVHELSESGSPFAQRLLGARYAYERNFEQALHWFRLSAEQGNRAAQRYLGDLYLYGKGVDKNEVIAEQLFLKASSRVEGMAKEIQTYCYPDGSFFTGYLVNNIMHGQGKFTWSNEDAYDGNWVNNQRNGYGKMIYADGSIYEGNWINDQRSGNGKMAYSDGFVYEGSWINDQRNGYGKGIQNDGGYYEGNWSNDLQQGYGTFNFPDGALFEGNWLNGKRNGNGKLSDKEIVYEGNWVDNLWEGRGKLKVGGFCYEGNFSSGERNGQGRAVFEDGCIYEGNWINSNRQGQGKLIQPDGIVFQGNWINDQLNGICVVINLDGTRIEGTWVDGKLQGESLQINPDKTRFEGRRVNGIFQGDGILIESDGTRREIIFKDGTYEFKKKGFLGLF